MENSIIIYSSTSDNVCTLFFKLVEISYWNVLHLYFNELSSLNMKMFQPCLFFLTEENLSGLNILKDATQGSGNS